MAPVDYRAGGAACDPAHWGTFTPHARQRRADFCADRAEQHRQAEGSLVAAQRLAEAGEDGALALHRLAEIAAWALGLCVLGLGLLTAALAYARQAARHGARGAMAALAVLDRQTAEARPILLVEADPSPIDGWERTRSLRTTWQVRLVNVGDSVAILRGVSARSAIVVPSGEQNPGAVPPLPPVKPLLQAPAHLTAGQASDWLTVKSDPLADTPEGASTMAPASLTAQAKAHGGVFWIHGQVVYEDVRGRRYETAFCLSTRPGTKHWVALEQGAERGNYRT